MQGQRSTCPSPSCDVTQQSPEATRHPIAVLGGFTVTRLERGTGTLTQGRSGCRRWVLVCPAPGHHCLWVPCSVPVTVGTRPVRTRGRSELCSPLSSMILGVRGASPLHPTATACVWVIWGAHDQPAKCWSGDKVVTALHAKSWAPVTV